MAATIETRVFEYHELDERAKERARDWYRELDDFSDFGAECMFDDFERICAILGVTLGTRSVKLYGGGTRHDANIYYSGFCSQGDGACFEGEYRYAKGAVSAIKEYAPQDTKLHRIAAELAAVQKRNFYQLTASMRHYGHYYHSGCMSVDVERDSSNYQTMTADADETVTQAMRDLADWLYSSLEREWEYQNSDDVVAENIIANEYTFTESGRRFG